MCADILGYFSQRSSYLSTRHAFQAKRQNWQCIWSVSCDFQPSNFARCELRKRLTNHSTGDHRNAMQRMVRDGNVDVITGDWLSEMNIAWNAIAKKDNPQLGYEVGFLEQLEDCIDDIVAKGIKVITNAGALNTPCLTQKVKELCGKRGHDNIVVASVVGDDISHLLSQSVTRKPLKLFHLDHSEQLLEDWDLASDIQTGVAYLGAKGIAAALNSGADIVVCGRVTDASPVVGAARWWYRWPEDSFDELAGALVAGRKFRPDT